MEEASTAMRVAVVLWQRSPITQCQNLSNYFSCSAHGLWTYQHFFDISTQLRSFMSVHLAKTTYKSVSNYVIINTYL